MARQSTRYTKYHFTYGSTDTDTELHVSADASKMAYGVACYIRFEVNNRPKCSFVMSKSKLASVNKYKINIKIDSTT